MVIDPEALPEVVKRTDFRAGGTHLPVAPNRHNSGLPNAMNGVALGQILIPVERFVLTVSATS
jgi:hypothetical protein